MNEPQRGITAPARATFWMATGVLIYAMVCAAVTAVESIMLSNAHPIYAGIIVVTCLMSLPTVFALADRTAAWVGGKPAP